MDSIQQQLKQQQRLQLERQLARELQDLRDTLTRLSLSLQDLSFEVDASQRQAARKLATDCLARHQPWQL